MLTEKELGRGLENACPVFGWRYYHTWRSIHSVAGFPDYVLVRGDRLIFAELKSSGGKTSMAQRAWLLDLVETGAEVYLWNDIDQVIPVLQGRKT